MVIVMSYRILDIYINYDTFSYHQEEDKKLKLKKFFQKEKNGLMNAEVQDRATYTMFYVMLCYDMLCYDML